MDDFEDIQQLWHSNNPLDIPNVQQMQKVISQYQRKKKRNTLIVTVLFALLGVSFLMIILLHNPLLWTTTVGKILIVLGFLSGIILKFKGLKNLNKNESKSSKEYLEELVKNYTHKRGNINWHLLTSVLLLTIGYGFFIYEQIKSNQTLLMFGFLGIVIFLFGMYFIFKPIVRKISKNKVDRMLQEIQNL